MNKIILKISIILLLGLFAINLIANSAHAKYYITENLEAININIVIQNENQNQIKE